MAKQSLAGCATLCILVGLSHPVVAQRLEPTATTPATAKPEGPKDGAPSPYGGLAPFVRAPAPTPERLDTLIAFPALPLSRFSRTPDAAPDHFRPPPPPPAPAPPPQAWTALPPVPPPRETAESRHTPRPIKVVRRPKAPARPEAAPAGPVTMPSLLQPTWH